MCELLTKWYYEKDIKDAKDIIEASGVEIFLFYLSLIVLFIFSFFVLFRGNFQWEWRYLVVFIPVSIWLFLRCSRKDMSATGKLIAGLFGGIGGSIATILIQKLTQ